MRGWCLTFPRSRPTVKRQSDWARSEVAMNRSCLSAMALSLLAPLAPARAADEPKPNVVIIFIDDLGYADIGPFGATKQKTPNLDRMAAEGMKLTSFYAAPVCSVSRAQLLTGCYGARVSVPGVYFPAGPQGLNPREVTIAERLKELRLRDAMRRQVAPRRPARVPAHEAGLRPLPRHPVLERHAAEVEGDRRAGRAAVRDDKVAELLTDEQQSQVVERYTGGGRRVHPREQGQAVLPVPPPHGGSHADPCRGEVPREVRQRAVRRLGRGGGLERRPGAATRFGS